MFKWVRSKSIAIILVFSIVLFYSPQLLRGEETGKGTLVGFVYGPDNVTPVEGAVVKLKNVQTGAAYESLSSDEQGMVELADLDEGLYIVGISTGEGDFNIGNLIGIKEKETAKVSFALKPGQTEGEAITKNERCPRGEYYVPEIQGQCEDNYKWNAETGRCECKKKMSPLAFFLSPLGAGLILAASAGVVAFAIYGGGEPSASAFK